MKRLIAMSILMLVGMTLIIGCAKPTDQKAYEETVATMSVEKAKKFFKDFPRSPYRDRLANEIVEWCRREETAECYRMILDTLPKDHPKHEELVAYYGKKFGKRE